MMNKIIDHILTPIFSGVFTIAGAAFGYVHWGDIANTAITGVIGGVTGWIGMKTIQWIFGKIFPNKKKHKKEK